MRLRACSVIVVAACAAPPPPPEPPPLKGATPATVLLLPTVDHVGARDAVLALDVSLFAPVSERGYYVIPIDVGLDVLRACGVTKSNVGIDSLPLAALRSFGVAAVLGTELHEWKRLGIEGPIRSQVSWRLVDTATGRDLWRLERRGDALGEMRQVLAGPFFSDEPVMGRDFVRWVYEEREEVDPREVARGLQARMATTLPLGPLLSR